MQTKLTLRLEEQLIEHAKTYARQSGKSLSQIVADYFVQLEKPALAPESAPVTSSLRGILKSENIDEKDYQAHLEDKYL